MRKDASGKDNSEMRGMYRRKRKAEVRSVSKLRKEEEGVKATIPEGEHPFDYLFEGHQYLTVGCLLLEEVDSRHWRRKSLSRSRSSWIHTLNASENSTRESRIKRNDRFRES